MTRNGGTRIRELTDEWDPALNAAYRLLRKTFHQSERVELSEWHSSLREKATRVWTDIDWHLLVAESRGQVCGLASGTYLGNVNVGVIGYLAAAPASRSSGVGSRLRARLRSRFARDARRITGEPLAGIVGEVSPGNPWLRRLARRPEVLVLDFPYFQPRLAAGDDPSPFVLYYESIGRVRKVMPVGELRRLLYTIWRRVYRVPRPIDRPAFRAMLRALEGRRSIGRRRIETSQSDP